MLCFKHTFIINGCMISYNLCSELEFNVNHTFIVSFTDKGYRIKLHFPPVFFYPCVLFCIGPVSHDCTVENISITDFFMFYDVFIVLWGKVKC